MSALALPVADATVVQLAHTAELLVRSLFVDQARHF